MSQFYLIFNLRIVPIAHLRCYMSVTIIHVVVVRPPTKFLYIRCHFILQAALCLLHKSQEVIVRPIIQHEAVEKLRLRFCVHLLQIASLSYERGFRTLLWHCFDVLLKLSMGIGKNNVIDGPASGKLRSRQLSVQTGTEANNYSGEKSSEF